MLFHCEFHHADVIFHVVDCGHLQFEGGIESVASFFDLTHSLVNSHNIQVFGIESRKSADSAMADDKLRKCRFTI